METEINKPNCITCTESKHTVEPFSKKAESKIEPGEHSEEFKTTELKKQKSKIAQRVKRYQIYLKNS